MDADLRRLCARIAAAAGIGCIPLLLASYASDETVELCLESPPDTCPSAIDALPLLYVENGTDRVCSPSAVIGEAIPEKSALGDCCYEVIESCNNTMGIGCRGPRWESLREEESFGAALIHEDIDVGRGCPIYLILPAHESYICVKVVGERGC